MKSRGGGVEKRKKYEVVKKRQERVLKVKMITDVYKKEVWAEKEDELNTIEKKVLAYQEGYRSGEILVSIEEYYKCVERIKELNSESMAIRVDKPVYMVDDINVETKDVLDKLNGVGCFEKLVVLSVKEGIRVRVKYIEGVIEEVVTVGVLLGMKDVTDKLKHIIGECNDMLIERGEVVIEGVIYGEGVTTEEVLEYLGGKVRIEESKMIFECLDYLESGKRMRARSERLEQAKKGGYTLAKHIEVTHKGELTSTIEEGLAQIDKKGCKYVEVDIQNTSVRVMLSVGEEEKKTKRGVVTEVLWVDKGDCIVPVVQVQGEKGESIEIRMKQPKELIIYNIIVGGEVEWMEVAGEIRVV